MEAVRWKLMEDSQTLAAHTDLIVNILTHSKGHDQNYRQVTYTGVFWLQCLCTNNALHVKIPHRCFNIKPE